MKLKREYCIPFLILFFIATTSYGGGIDENSIPKLLLSTLVASVWLFSMKINVTDVFFLVIIGLLLLLNIFINNCGIGGAIGCWEFFVLLFIAKHVTISKKTFNLLFYFSSILMYLYAFNIYSHPELIVSALGGEMNPNMVSIYSFFMMFFAILFIPKFNKINVVILIVTILAALFLIAISGSRSSQIVSLFTFGGLIYIKMKGKLSRNSRRFLYFFSLFILIFAIIYVIISINSNHSFIISFLGWFSGITGNVKGSDLSLRGEMWSEALGYFLDSPFIGTGSKVRLKVYGDEALALHNSSLNILIVYGIIIYFFFLVKEMAYFKKLFLGKYTSILVVEGCTIYIGILLMSYSESLLMDFSKFYSMVPLYYAFSKYNSNRNLFKI